MIANVRPHDVAITDFRFVMVPDGVLTDRRGRSYMSYALIPRATKPAPAPDDTVSERTRRLVAWALYTLCGAAAATAIWFAFIVPCSCTVPSWSLERSAGPAARTLPAVSSVAALHAPDIGALARVP